MSDAAEVPGEDASGRVSWFNTEKQFGFVKLDGGKGDAFLHMSVLKAGGYYSLPRGTSVQVRVEPDRGKHRVIQLLHADASTAQHGEPPPSVRKQEGGDLDEALARSGEADPSENPDRDGADD